MAGGVCKNMAGTEMTLTSLAKSGATGALEDRWLAAIENGNHDREDLLGALAALTHAGRGEQATALAWTWLTTCREKASPTEVLTLGRELIVRCAENDEMRKEILRLYEEVFADRPGITQLFDASGLRGGKAPRRALRTLDICLGLEVGSFLISRSDERITEVTAVDPEACEYTLRTRNGTEVLDADSVGLNYDPIDANDFRVLLKLRPERIKEMLQSDPLALAIGILRSRGDQMNADTLEQTLCPTFLPSKTWKEWWSRTKTLLKRSPNVSVEGRSPIILTYHAQAQTLEDEIEPQWERADTPSHRLSVVDTYAREARNRGSAVQPALLQRMYNSLIGRVKAAWGSPRHALPEALVVDRLAELGAKVEGSPAAQIVKESQDLVALLASIEEPAFFNLGAELVRNVLPERWAEVFAELLPIAPVEGCDPLAKALEAGGHHDKLVAAVERIPADFTRHMDAVCWLWKGPSVEGIVPMPDRELLLRILEHLGEMGRDDHLASDVLRNARIKIRAALSAGKYSRFRQVIEGMDAAMASTVRRTIERLDGLGQVVHSTLLRIIQDTYPELYVKARIDPWLDENILLGTQSGMTKREEELNYLVNVKMTENAKAIGEAAAHGDLSENSEYKFALEERDLLRARVAAIQNELSRARLLTQNDVVTDTVDVGTHVTLQSVDGQLRREMTILGPWEADIEKGVYNYKAPLCSKLRGLRVGETAHLELDSAEREYRIEAITNALEGVH